MSITTRYFTWPRSRSCGSFRLLNLDRGVVDENGLARGDLARLAQLDLAVALHLTLGDACFGRAAAVGEAHQLEQVVQFDVIAREREFESRHVSGLRKVGGGKGAHDKPAGHATRVYSQTPDPGSFGWL